MKDKAFSVTFLGISAAAISPKSATSACLVEIGKTKIMVDAGIGALRQLKKVGVTPDMLDAVLLTHWHLDHCAGLPGLIRYRTKPSPLPVLGPRPPLTIFTVLHLFFPAILRCFKIVGGSYATDFKDIHAEAFESAHRIASIGWIITENPSGNRRVVISGDTRPTEAIAGAARGADLLIHEATYLKRHAARAISRRHSTVPEAVNLAVKSMAGGLALNHIARRYLTKTVRTEAEGMLPGVYIPSPLDTISIDTQTDEGGREGYGWAKLKVARRGPK